MRHEQPVSIRRKCGWRANERVQPGRQFNLLRSHAGPVSQIRINSPVFVQRVSERFAIAREICRARLPFCVSNPCQFFAGHVEQRNILKTIFLSGSDQERLAVRRSRRRGIENFSLVGCQILQLAGCDIDRVNIRLRHTTGLAAIGKQSLAIGTPRHGTPGVSLCRFVRQLANFPRRPI